MGRGVCSHGGGRSGARQRQPCLGALDDMVRRARDQPKNSTCNKLATKQATSA